MHKLAAAFAALRHGASLADPAVWKRRQNLINALVGLLGAALVLYPMDISNDDIAAIVGGIAAVVGLFNAWATTATSTKVGLPPRHPPAVRPPFPDLIDRPDDPRIEP
ncbi:hypothetical protein PA01_12790 [Azoarcus sp. PA01]|nr:hypothetical protein PA01_12790 [Azoarcus sp. PA01]